MGVAARARFRIFDPSERMAKLETSCHARGGAVGATIGWQNDWKDARSFRVINALATLDKDREVLDMSWKGPLLTL